jgi:hypothetical protein
LRFIGICYGVTVQLKLFDRVLERSQEYHVESGRVESFVGEDRV